MNRGPGACWPAGDETAPLISSRDGGFQLDRSFLSSFCFSPFFSWFSEISMEFHLFSRFPIKYGRRHIFFPCHFLRTLRRPQIFLFSLDAASILCHLVFYILVSACFSREKIFCMLKDRYCSATSVIDSIYLDFSPLVQQKTPQKQKNSQYRSF
ncbi:hypothetical protein CSA57_14675 [candidate division KSB3 bacterium]|nr:MAG: hypothetical protein CSA57_14675 [candidate division KSB3 bacterium]